MKQTRDPKAKQKKTRTSVTNGTELKQLGKL